MKKKDIYVEIIKIVRKKSFKIFNILLIIGTILLTLFIPDSSSNNYEYYPKMSFEEYSELGYDDYDNYLEKYDQYNSIISDDILKEEYALKNDFVFHEEVKNDLSISDTIVLFLSIYIIILASSSFGYEYDKNTIKLILLNKRDRVSLVLSKFISLLIVSLYLSFTVYIVNLLTTMIIHNIDLYSVNVLISGNGNISEKSLLFEHTIEYMKLLVPWILLISISLFMGLVFKGSTLSSSIGIFLLLSGTLVTELFLDLKIKVVEYTFLPYLDFTIFKDKVTLILYNIERDINLSFVNGTFIIIIYSIIILLLCSLIFRRRELD